MDNNPTNQILVFSVFMPSLTWVMHTSCVEPFDMTSRPPWKVKRRPCWCPYHSYGNQSLFTCDSPRKPSIMKMEISEKWRKLSVNQEIPCVYPFPGYCSCSDTRNICLNLIRISMWLFAFKRFKIEKSSMIVVDFVVNVSTHLFKTNFYILKVSWCSNRSMKYERNQCVNGLFTFCRGL